MSVVAFCVLGILLSGYVILDGYDLGMAALLLFVGHDDGERSRAREAIAPFWNGNEVFLVAAGASLFAFFSTRLRVGVQRILSPFYCCIMAADGARNLLRDSRDDRAQALALILGLRVLGL